MSSEKDYEYQITEMMKAKAQQEGFDPSEIHSGNVHVDTTGPTFSFAYGGATMSVPAPSRAAVDEWFKDNGKYIAGALLFAAGAVFGKTIAKP